MRVLQALLLATAAMLLSCCGYNTHQMQQTIYMATYNDAPGDKEDIFKILTQATPQEVEDKESPLACKLESYDATSTYEQ